MKTAKQLRELRAAKKSQMRAMVSTAKAEKRDLTDDEATQFDVLTAEVNAFEAQIQRAEAIEAMEAREAVKRNQPATGTPGPAGGEKREKKKIKERYSIARAINMQAEGRALTGIEAEMHQEAQKEALERGHSIAGIGVPSMLTEKRADLVAGTMPAGGETIDEELRGLLPILRPKLMVESLGATVLTGLTGNIRIPKQDAASVAEWEGETDENAQSDPTFSSINLSPKRLGAYTKFSKQLLAQSTISVDQFVQRDLETAIRIAVDAAAINGAGANGEPLGILNTPGINPVSGGTLTRDHLVDLETAISAENADMGTMNYLTTPGVRGLLKKTKTDAGSGIFVWGNGTTLNGYNAAVSTQVPSDLGGANHAMIFGDFSQLIMANWAGLDLVVDPYTLATQTMVRVIANSWWDMAVRYPKAFSAIVNATV